MTALILDAGALVAVDRGDQALMATLRAAVLEDFVLRTNPLAIAQVRRHRDGRHARLALLLLGRSGTKDVVDASPVLLAESGDRLVTSDLDDIRHLVEAAGANVSVLRC